MNLVKGEYKHSIDAKGRLAMPAKLRDELGERFTVTKGLDGCLAVYPEKEWESLEDRIRALGNGEKARRVKRYYFANAFDAQLEADTEAKLTALRASLEEDLNSRLAKQEAGAKEAVRLLNASYESHHAQYAKQLFEEMIKE